MSKSIAKLIDEQVKRWELEMKKKTPIHKKVNVITISREAGSKGMDVARMLCVRSEFDLFDHEIVDAMVETSKNSRALLETLDEKAMNVVDDVVSEFVNSHHLWPDEYSKLLFKILNTIASHGNAVIIGRGANCVLSGPHIIRVRMVAPPLLRRKNIQYERDLNKEDAQKYMISTDANRSAFVKRYFNCDATDPSNYDLILNTGTLSVEKAVQVILCAID
jgi:hypothetical protein